MTAPEPCSCPMAGWCDRHGIQKYHPQWQLCQTRPDYRKAWDDGRLAGQAGPNPDPIKEAKRAKIRERIKQRVAKSERFFAWIWLFRSEDDVGAGDTLQRLIEQCKPRHACLKRQMKDELQVCDCQLEVAIRKVNEQYPWVSSTTQRCQVRKTRFLEQS